MRKVFGRLVRRYLEVTGASLRTWDRDGAADHKGADARLRGTSLQERLRDDANSTPIDLRDVRAPKEPNVVELDAEVIRLDEAAGDRADRQQP